MSRHTIEEIEAKIRIPVAQWPGACSRIARACLDAKLVRGRYCYGHYLGPIARTGRFGGRGFAHHAWIELPDGRIWDPTRWGGGDDEW